MDWDTVLSHGNLDEDVDSFYSKLYSAIDKHIPSKRIVPSTFPQWYDTELKDKIFAKKRAHCKWKMSNLFTHFIEFKRLRAECLYLSRSKYKNYIESVESKIKCNSKAFWSYVKGSRLGSGLPNNTYLGNLRASKSSESLNLFSNHFGSVFSDNDLDELERNNLNNELLSHLHFTVGSLNSFILERPVMELTRFRRVS